MDEVAPDKGGSGNIGAIQRYATGRTTSRGDSIRGIGRFSMTANSNINPSHSHITLSIEIAAICFKGVFTDQRLIITNLGRRERTRTTSIGVRDFFQQ